MSTIIINLTAYGNATLKEMSTTVKSFGTATCAFQVEHLISEILLITYFSLFDY
jgi:hypothetical protein